jgi:hypothetical protein
LAQFAFVQVGGVAVCKHHIATAVMNHIRPAIGFTGAVIAVTVNGALGFDRIAIINQGNV